MRLVTFAFRGKNRRGEEQDGHVVDSNRGYALLPVSGRAPDVQRQADRELPADMHGFPECWDQRLPRAKEVLAFVRGMQASGSPVAQAIMQPIKAASVRAPILNPRKLICLGENYRDHAQESRADIPTEAVPFSQYATAITGPEEPILLPSAS
jgi:acylpyruvate hydrolase